MTTNVQERRETVALLRAKGLKPKEIAEQIGSDQRMVYADLAALSTGSHEPASERTARHIAKLGREIGQARGTLEQVRDDVHRSGPYSLVFTCLETAAQSLKAAKKAQELLAREKARKASLPELNGDEA